MTFSVPFPWSRALLDFTSHQFLVMNRHLLTCPQHLYHCESIFPLTTHIVALLASSSSRLSHVIILLLSPYFSSSSSSSSSSTLHSTCPFYSQSYYVYPLLFIIELFYSCSFSFCVARYASCLYPSSRSSQSLSSHLLSLFLSSCSLLPSHRFVLACGTMQPCI